jgi:UDP-N-acetylmuramate dehydrogenase
LPINQNISLAQFSTLKVGGTADFFARVSDLDELKEVVKFADSQNLPIFVFGGGSNILFSDAGFRGLVIKNEIRKIKFSANSAMVGAGELLANLLAQAVKNNLAGLQNLAGVPGTVGGAVVGNANSIGEKVSRVTIFSNGESKILERKDLKFSYRDSNLRDKILVEVEFELQKSSANLIKEFQKIVTEKLAKQPFKGTAGSWFKNPPDLAAWELIEKAGCRGLKIGGAQVSEKHANFFQNAGRAMAADFLELEKMVVEKVQEKFGVKLEREVIVVAES